MRIGIVSDTHKNKDLLGKVVTWLVQRQHIPTLYHLGDDYEDVVDIGEQFTDLVQVPGIYHEGYKSGKLPATTFETVLGLNLYLIHCFEKDAKEKDMSRTDIVLHGHTHKHEIRLDDGLLYFNPGHLKGPLDKNMPPTFGILDIQEKSVTASIYNMDFKIVQNMELMRSESGLYRAN